MANKAYLALGRLKVGEMNRLEADYAAHLAQMQAAGHILWHKFEAVKLRLADNTFYTPDFAVMSSDLRIELHEVKSIWRDDARVKIKVAADLYPFLFVAAYRLPKREGGGWKFEDFSRA